MSKSSIGRKILVLLLALCMVLSLMPTVALAEDSTQKEYAGWDTAIAKIGEWGEYEIITITIGTINYTYERDVSETCLDLGENALDSPTPSDNTVYKAGEDGYVLWQPTVIADVGVTGGVLTFHNATIDVTDGESEVTAVILPRLSDGVNVVFEGTNNITANSNAEARVFDCLGDVTFDLTAGSETTLTASDGENPTRNAYVIRLYEEGVATAEIKGNGTLKLNANANTSDYAISAEEHPVKLTGGTLDIRGSINGNVSLGAVAVPANSTLNLGRATTVTKGTAGATINGTLKLPAGTTADAVIALGLTGNGLVMVNESVGEDVGTRCFKSDGTPMVYRTQSLDFTNSEASGNWSSSATIATDGYTFTGNATDGYVLTLGDLVIDFHSAESAAICLPVDGKTDVILEGDTRITNSGTCIVFYRDSEEYPCTISGNGSLTLTSTTNGTLIVPLVSTQPLTIAGGNITAISNGRNAVNTAQKLTIAGGTLIASGSEYALSTAPAFTSGYTPKVTAGQNAESAITSNSPSDEVYTTSKYVKIEKYVPSGNGGRRSGGGTANTQAPVIVDGDTYNIGTANTTNNTTTLLVDQTALQNQLDAASDTVVIPVDPGNNTNKAVVQLAASNIDAMAEKEMTLSVKVDNVSYDMPAVAVDTGALLKELGATNPNDVPVNVTIAELSKDDVSLEEGKLIMPPVQFTVSASFGGQTTDIDTFNKYVQRVITITEDNAQKATTAVVVENGKQRHVPTEVFASGDKWYARINSLTNSTYAIIHNEASFADTKGKWYEDVATEMASRGIVDGRDENTFDGNANITRAEFAAILVRGLGLPENGDASMFDDVADNAWYYGAVGKAYEYGIVDGRSEGVFDPNARITRQEAMAMVHRAAAISEFAGTIGTLEGFSDASSVSKWALSDAQWNVGSGLIEGNGAGEICGKNYISRGETATIVLRLLQKSGLVDVRTEA